MVASYRNFRKKFVIVFCWRSWISESAEIRNTYLKDQRRRLKSVYKINKRVYSWFLFAKSCVWHAEKIIIGLIDKTSNSIMLNPSCFDFQYDSYSYDPNLVYNNNHSNEIINCEFQDTPANLETTLEASSNEIYEESANQYSWQETFDDSKWKHGIHNKHERTSSRKDCGGYFSRLLKMEEEKTCIKMIREVPKSRVPFARKRLDLSIYTFDEPSIDQFEDKEVILSNCILPLSNHVGCDVLLDEKKLMNQSFE